MPTSNAFVVVFVDIGGSVSDGATPPPRVRGVSTTRSNTCLYAAAPKKKKKAATKKSSSSSSKTDASVETFKKPEFVSSIQAKTGLSKVDSEAALNAVLDTISEVT